MAKINVLISVDEQAAGFADVVERLRHAGLSVQREMATLGVVAGSADRRSIGRLERLDGVCRIEEQRSYAISPPGGKVQ